MKLIFDIEADHLLEEATTVHCIVAIDPDTDTVYTFEPDSIKKGLSFIAGTSGS